MPTRADSQDYDFESPDGVRPPGVMHRALEARAPFEALSSLALWPLLQAGPCGDDLRRTGAKTAGHPVPEQRCHPLSLPRRNPRLEGDVP